MKIIIGLILSVHKLQEAKFYFALYVFESWDKEIKKAPVPGRKYPNPRMTRSECIVVIWGTFFYQYGLSDFWPRVCEWPEPPGTVGQVPSLEMTTSKKKSWGGIEFNSVTALVTSTHLTSVNSPLQESVRHSVKSDTIEMFAAWKLWIRTLLLCEPGPGNWVS